MKFSTGLPRLFWLSTFKDQGTGFQGIIVSVKHACKAVVVDGLEVYGMENLGDVVDFFNGTHQVTPVKVDLMELFTNEANSLNRAGDN
jgi:magnesium chelatase family protein